MMPIGDVYEALILTWGRDPSPEKFAEFMHANGRSASRWDFEWWCDNVRPVLRDMKAGTRRF